ncbi:hypothetical protein [Halorubrum salinum]|uniref:hypothetical protein n=1 Tax=Halorubrum salinum TaxID=767517 RepID=UPI0021126FEC|nr:hypothetical protein [Halorubrum salinum]
MRLDRVRLCRPIIRWVDGDRVPANPFTKEPVSEPLGTALIPRRRIAGKHINDVQSEAIPVRGWKDGRYVLAIAPEHASVDVFDPGRRDPGDPPLDVTESWVPLVAVFTVGERGAVVVPCREVEV